MKKTTVGHEPNAASIRNQRLSKLSTNPYRQKRQKSAVPHTRMRDKTVDPTTATIEISNFASANVGAYKKQQQQMH